MAETQAAILHWNPAETAALIAKVRQALPRVTAENATAYGLLAEDVQAWAASAAGANANVESLPSQGSPTSLSGSIAVPNQAR